METIKTSSLFLIIFSLCTLASLTFGSEEQTRSGQFALSDILARMAKADEASMEKMRSVPLKPTDHMRGSMRALQVPYIKIPPDHIEETAVKDIPAPLIAIDGHLNDALWNKAAVSGGFWCSFENKAPADPTEVLVARDSNYLYFGFRLHDKHPETIQSATTVRDVGLGYDDAITIQLDTFFNRRDISEFSLNPLGTQTDDFSGGRSAKVEWKGDWQGSAARTEYGWSAEFAIPFAILNYNKDDTKFGVNYRRYQSRSKQHSYWADITPKGLAEEMGQLNGLVLPAPEDRKAWTFMPFALAGANIPDKEGELKDSLVTGGIDIRYQPRQDMTGMLSINPDFSQIEEAIADISFSYSEKAVDDNRPFFVEGEDYFSSKNDGNEYFYSNRAADFDFGGKGFGRIGNTKFGIFATGAPEDRYDGVGRLLHELDDTHSAITTVAATRQSAFENLLAVGQFKGRQPIGLEYALDAAISDTRDAGASDPIEGRGSHLKGSLGWKSNYWYLRGSADQYDVAYFPALALLAEDLPGTRAGSVTTGYYRKQAEHFWRIIDSYAGYKYRGTLDDQLQNRKWFTGASVEFENQIRTTVYAEEGPYRPATDVRGVFEDYTFDDRYYSMAVDFNTRSSVVSIGSRYDWGQLGGGDYEYYSVYGWWRPVTPLYLNVSAERTDYFGTSDQLVLTGSWNITAEQALGGRYIYTDDVDYYRLAYSYKPRKGLDIYAVYEDNSVAGGDGEYSIKIVKTF